MDNLQLDQLKIIDDKMARLKAQRQAIVNRKKEKERKQRTRRLIQMGALAESYLDIHSVDAFEAWLKDYKNGGTDVDKRPSGL